MRIALETLDPLPFYKSWFVFEENDDSTVADLRKALNRSFQLAKKSSHIKLMSGGFEYLPQFKLKNYILNNEVIIVESSKDKPILKTPVVMETQTKKKKEEDKKKRAKETKKREKEEKKKKQVEEKKSSQPKEKELKKKRKREEDDDKTNVELKEDEPVKKMTKTQKRNLRRKLVIKKRKEQQKQQQQLNQSTVEKETASSDNEPPTQLSSRKEVSTTPSNDTIKKPSTHLLKQNKNKKANFLKRMDKKQQSHFRFEPSTSDNEEKEQKKVLQDTQEEEHQKQELNDNGSAIVTWNEADENYDGPTKGNVQYPIYNVGNYFHADAASIPAKDNGSTIETKNMTNKSPLAPKVTEKPDYEKLPSLSFSGPFPEPNDLLAIKLLEMSSSYTPEISDWKQVKVLEFDQEQGILNVEFQPGFLLKEQTGKFTIRENNGYHDEEEEEEEEEEVEQYLEDQTKQLTQMDIVDMRRL